MNHINKRENGKFNFQQPLPVEVPSWWLKLSNSCEPFTSPTKQVAKIDIGYAKSAKKMDVRKLKSTMWNILTAIETEENKVGTEQFKLIQLNPGISNCQGKLKLLPSYRGFEL